MRYLLGPQGPFSRALPGFEYREGQIQLAEAVAETIAHQDRLVAEAGPGIGKTFGYLVPALESRRKVLISTGTRNLQDQLFFRDLPRVKQVLGSGAVVALLKGRTNYLCLYRLELAENHPDLLRADLGGALLRVRATAARSPDGDLDRVPGLEDPILRTQITATAENCLGSECPRIDDCFVYRARRRAQEADIVVINHHLFFADLAVRGGGFGEVVPDTDVTLFDEAHLAPDIAVRFLGSSLGTAQLQELCRDVAVVERGLPDPRALERAAELEANVDHFRASLPADAVQQPWNLDSDNREIEPRARRLLADIGELQSSLEAHAGQDQGLDNCLARARLFYDRLETFLDGPPGESVRWLEQQAKSVTFRTAPMDIAPILQERLFNDGRTWIFTSATLSVGDDFSYFTGRIGLSDCTTLRIDAPFDYPHNALLYLPRKVPEPNRPDYTEQVVHAVLPVLQASQGRAFYLFTSHAAMQRAAQLLAELSDFILLVQGRAPRTRLLEQFRELPRAVLLGTGSFWQGIDVVGPTLSCVIIEKLPFAVPDDPLVRARVEALEARGENAFIAFQIPEAAMTLKQGAGRLIRHRDDRGVLVIADPRLLSRAYGKRFLASLPPMPLTQELDEVQAFFRPIDTVSRTP